MSFRSVLVLAIAGILWSCVLGLQRPAPSYSMESMPKTDFTCRNKIIGSYYADPETDCQLFHVCVSVAGSVQDYRFLCPNDTAFDQESQTCADWYDVDCEAATLYYASDNFDLYRLGSGLESLHYDSIRNDAEPQDHLQRSETNDPVRSAASLSRVAQTDNYNNNNNNNNNNKDILRGSSSSNFYNRNGKDDQDYNDKPYREEPAPEPKKKTGVRKVARKQQYYNNNSNNNNNNNVVTATYAPSTAAPTTDNYKYNAFNHRSTYEPTSTAQPDFSRRQNQKFNSPTTTFRPPTQSYSTYSAPSTTARTTYNSFSGNYNSNAPGAYGQVPTTAKPAAYNQGSQSQITGKPNYRDQRTQERYEKFSFDQRSTTLAPSTNYQANDYTNYRNYNNVQRSTSSSTTAATTFEAYSGSNNQYRTNSARQGPTQTTKFYNNYSGNYAPTTYSPKADVPSRTTERPYSQADGQYQFDKNSQAKSTQFYDSTKAPKKVTPGSFDVTNSGKFYENSTPGYDFARSQSAIGFSPASINLLAETPKTTPTPRRSAPTTYNPGSYRASQSTTARPLVSSARPFSTTIADATTPRPKSSKKNDYDYAYYDNAGALEYEGLDLENVARNKESAKISRA